MGVVQLEKEFFEKVRVLKKTYYSNLAREMKFIAPHEPKMKDGKDVSPPVELIVGKDLTIETARKLVQAQKVAAVYAPGKKPREV